MEFSRNFKKIKIISAKTLIWFFLSIIRVYKLISRAPKCRFLPSCSDYATMQLKKHGIRAIPRIIWRILQCNPFVKQSVRLE